MTTATPSQRTLARWLLASEPGTAEGSASGLDAAATVFDKVNYRLSQLITPTGSEAVLRRAVRLSRVEFPVLDRVDAVTPAGSVVARLCEAATTVEPDQAHEGLVSVLGNMVAVLELLIGEDLAFRALHDVWPSLPMWQPMQSSRKNGTGKLEANR
jgi:hypothetical protein